MPVRPERDRPPTPGYAHEFHAAAAELVGPGIRVNNFGPGVTDTPMLDGRHGTRAESDAMRAMYIKMTPMGRLGRPTEMASAIFFIASDGGPSEFRRRLAPG